MCRSAHPHLRMKRIFKTFIVALCLTAVACTDYQVDIDSLNERVDNLETSKIATITQQIQSINASIPALQSTSSELKTLVNSLKKTVEGYDAAIAENEAGLAQLKADIEKSIAEIQKSIEEGQDADKQEMLDALNAAKAEIEAQIAALQTDTENKLDQMNEVVSDLQEKDASIEARIDSLKSFVNEELTSQKDWATKTFATLKQQQAIQSDITSIKGDISSLQSALTALETRITKEYTKAINDAVASLENKIAATANEITVAYTNAIAKAKEEITTAYEKAIKDAIDALETSLKGWVSEQLKGYYTTAQIKAKIDSLHGVINDQIEVQQASIDALEAVLGDTKEIEKAKKTIVGLINENADNFTELYNALTKSKDDMTNDEKAIVSAIVKDGGAVSNLVKEKVKEYVDGLKDTENWITGRFEDIEEDVKTLKGEVDDLKEEVSGLSTKLSNFINGRVQSLTYIPTTVEGDHWVGAVDDEAFGNIVLNFRVSPASMAKKITIDQVSAKVYYPGYNTYGGYFPVTVQEVGQEPGQEEGNYNDVIGVIIKAEDVFSDYIHRAEISVSVKDATNNYYDVASEFVTVNAEHYFIEYTSLNSNDFASATTTFTLNDSKTYSVRKHNYYNFVEVQDGTTNLTAKFNTNIQTLKFGAYLDKSNMSDKNYGWNYDDWKTVQLTSGENVFKGCQNLTSVDFGFGLSNTGASANDEQKHRSGLGTKNVTSFERMFEGCTNLSDVDMTYCNTARVTTMFKMFDSCLALREIDLSGWNTSALTTTQEMFQGCKNLTKVDLKGWNASNLTNFQAMFDGCTNLTKVDLDWATFSTSTPISFYATFRSSGIQKAEVKLPSMTIWKLTEMFKDCTGLTNVSLVPQDGATVTIKHTSEASGMNFMFYGCTALQTVDLSGWTIPNNADLRGMFQGCTNLTTITLNGWKLENDADFTGTITDLLQGCSNLKTINLINADTRLASIIYTAIQNAGLTGVSVNNS